MMAVVTDRKITVQGANISCLMQQKPMTDFYIPNVVSYSDYYPFGMQMPGRNDAVNSYRYKHQGQESDSEIYGEGNSYAYTYRMSDARLGRFWSIDPLAPDYPWNSPYAYSENKLIAFVELEGLESYYAADGKYLGKVGTSPDIRVVNDEVVWDNYISVINTSVNTTLDKDDKNYRREQSTEQLLVKNSSKVYKENELFDLFKEWGSDYKPKSESQEFAMIVYSKTFTNENGDQFKAFVPGTTTYGGSTSVYFLDSELKIGGKFMAGMVSRGVGSAFESKNGWGRHSVIHTHPKGGEARKKFSYDDYGLSLEYDMPIYMIQYNSSSLYEFKPSVYKKYSEFKSSYTYGKYNFQESSLESAREEYELFFYEK